MSDEVQEYGVRIAGGAVHVRPTGDQGTEADWVKANQEQGIPVITRKVVVVEDWQELPAPAQ